MKRPKYLPQQLNLLAASGLFFALLVVIYQIAGRANHRIDLTREKVYSVSRETVAALAEMREGAISVRAYFSENDPARREFEILLKELSTKHPKFRVEFFDPDRSPSEARKDRVDSYRTSVIKYEERPERIQGVEEEVVTNALIRLAHPEAQTICFTTGHGENSLFNTDRTGLSEWKQVLEDQQFQVREIETVGQAVPEECRVLVMAGPRYELFPEELGIFQKFPMEGKGLLLLVDPMDPGEGETFHKLLEPFGVRLGGDVIIDKVSKLVGGDYLIPLVSQYVDHPITRRFNVATFLPIARTVNRAGVIRGKAEVVELAFTTPGSWAETDLKTLEEGEAELSPGVDREGPVPVAVASEFRRARVAVVGDSDFVTNTHLRLSGNKDFALNLLQWLVRDDRWIAVRTKETKFEPLFLRGNQPAGIALFSLGVLPFTALAAGSIGIWRRRRKSL